MFASDTVDRSRKGRRVAAVLGAAAGLSAILSTTAPAFADDGPPISFMAPANKWSLAVKADDTVAGVDFRIVRKDDPSITVWHKCAGFGLTSGAINIMHPAPNTTLDLRFEYEGMYAARPIGEGCGGKFGPTMSVPDFDPFSATEYTVSVSFAPTPTPAP